MGVRRRVGDALVKGMPLVLAVVPACNMLSGAGDLNVGPPEDGIDAGRADAPDMSARDTSTGPTAYGLGGWAYQRNIALTSDETTPLTNHAVLVAVPKSFDYSHAKSAGEDLRFAVDPAQMEDLPYFVEDWMQGSESHVWVDVPAVPPGASTLHMFYGNPAAAEASRFASTFPNARRTEGGGKGSFVALENIDVDWFELRAGDTLTLASGVPLRISARRIIVAGTIEGSGRGHGGGTTPSGAGVGPGGGMILAGSGAGGGGYGGSGGAGGSDNGIGGAGGSAYGTAGGDDIAMGSGGGTMDSKPAGDGGGSLSLVGWRTSIGGAITMSGTAGAGLSGQNSGGGAGGGLLIAGWSLDLAGAQLTANGGIGGPCAQAANDAGGGGAGGRIKLKRRASGALSMPASMSVLPGAGGAGAATTAPGAIGTPGTTDVAESSAFARGVETVLEAEQSAR
jgi:hypothetical protein